MGIEDEVDDALESELQGSTDDADPLAQLMPKDVIVSPAKSTRSASVRVANAKAQAQQPPVKAGSHVKSRRSQLCHCLPADLQKCMPREDPNYKNYCGTAIKKSKGRKSGYDVRFDCFQGNEIAPALQRKMFTTVKKGTEEAQVDPKHMAKLSNETEELLEVVRKEDIEVKSEKEFVKQPTLGNTWTRQHLLLVSLRFHSCGQMRITGVEIAETSHGRSSLPSSRLGSMSNRNFSLNTTFLCWTNQ